MSVCRCREEVAVKVWHEPVAEKELPFIHVICYHVKPTQGDLSDCHGFATSPRLLRSAQCPSPKGHQSISWLNIQTGTKSTHIEHGMRFPNAREVKTNHSAKLWISCKASVNRPIRKLVYFATNDLSDSPCSHYHAILGFKKSLQLRWRSEKSQIAFRGELVGDKRIWSDIGWERKLVLIS